MISILHIAGVHVTVGNRLRQRCAWCGAVLIDYDLALVAVPVGQEGAPAVWPVGDLVLVDGHVSALVEHVDGEPVPEGACARLDPEVTR